MLFFTLTIETFVNTRFFLAKSIFFINKNGKDSMTYRIAELLEN